MRCSSKYGHLPSLESHTLSHRVLVVPCTLIRYLGSVSFLFLLASLAQDLGVLQGHIPWLRLLIVSGHTIANFVEQDIKALDADQFELEAPIAFPGVQDYLLGLLGYGGATHLVSVLSQGDQLLVRGDINDATHVGSVRHV